MIEQQRTTQEQSNNQLQRQFTKPEFLAVITQLLVSLKIRPIDSIDQLYESVKQKNGRVVGKDILETVEVVKQQNQGWLQLTKQIANYRNKINQLTKKGIMCISVLQYYSLFGKQGIIAQQINKYIEKQSYISLAKLTKFINKIQQMSSKSRNINLNSSELKAGGFGKSGIFQQDEFLHSNDNEIKASNIIEYVQQNILDAGICINLKAMLQKLDRKMYDLEQNQAIHIQVQNSLRSKMQQIDNELYYNYKQLDNKKSQSQKMISKIRDCQQEIKKLNLKYKEQVINSLGILQQQNDRLSKYIKDLTVKYQQSQTKLQWFRVNYEGLSKEYEEYVKDKQKNENKEKKQREERMFTQRTIKQQLEDAQGKISRLRTQNGDLKNKNIQLAFSYQNTINSLQAKIKELQDGMQTSKLKLNYESQFRNSYLAVNRNINEYYDDENKTIRNSKILSRIDELEQKKSIYRDRSQIRSSVQSFKDIIISKSYLDPNAFKKSKKIISINAQSLATQSQVQDQTVQDQQLEEQKKQKQKSTVSKNKTFSYNKQKKQTINQKQSTNKKKVFTNLGYLINAQGAKHPTYFMISQDRITFLDSKMRQNYSIKLSQLRKIIFCYHNSYWIVLKLRSHQKNEKNQELSDILLSTLNRSQVLQFLRQRCANKLYEFSVKIQFERQNSIWITGVSSQTLLSKSQTLLSNYVNCYNLNRISISNAGNMFEASLKSNSIFNFDNNVILVVTSLGILAFEADGDYYLQRQQNLLNLIPIVQLMEIQVIDEYRIKLKYPSEKKTVYQIKLSRRSYSKKLIKLIQQIRQNSRRDKAQQSEKYSLLTSVLNKQNQVQSIK